MWKCKKNRNTVFCLQLLALVSLSGLFLCLDSAGF
nr:MAG TPA: hypothetical protein [Caudoviricetes sp.]